MFGKRQAATVALLTALFLPDLTLATPALACAIPPSHHFSGSIRAYFADLKSGFPESDDYFPETALTEYNYVAVLSGLVKNVGVNGIRVPMVADYMAPQIYSGLYGRILAYAKGIGLMVYASPLSFGPDAYDGWSDDRYAAWVADYVAFFRPRFVSPFNEAGFTDDRMRSILRSLRRRLKVPVVVLGPDKKTVSGNLTEVSSPTSIAPLVDIVAAHNSGNDDSATADNWSKLVAAVPGDKPVWATEDPASWAVGQKATLPGIDVAVAAGIRGLVVWRGKPSLVDDAGQASSKACKLAAQIIVGD